MFATSTRILSARCRSPAARKASIELAPCVQLNRTSPKTAVPGESPDLRTRASARCPCQRFRILRVARAHHHVVAECDELPRQRLPNHAGTQDTVFHARFLWTWVVLRSHSRMAPVKYTMSSGFLDEIKIVVDHDRLVLAPDATELFHGRRTTSSGYCPTKAGHVTVVDEAGFCDQQLTSADWSDELSLAVDPAQECEHRLALGKNRGDSSRRPARAPRCNRLGSLPGSTC